MVKAICVSMSIAGFAQLSVWGWFGILVGGLIVSLLVNSLNIMDEGEDEDEKRPFFTIRPGFWIVLLMAIVLGIAVALLV